MPQQFGLPPIQVQRPQVTPEQILAEIRAIKQRRLAQQQALLPQPELTQEIPEVPTQEAPVEEDQGFLAHGGALGGALTGGFLGLVSPVPGGLLAGAAIGGTAGAFGAPTGFQIGTGLGIQNPFARLAVDIIADPIALGATGIVGGLTKGGRAALSAQQLQGAAKVGSAVRAAISESKGFGLDRLTDLSNAIEDIIKTSTNPALANQFRRAIISGDRGAAEKVLKRIRSLGLDEETLARLPSKDQLRAIINVVDEESRLNRSLPNRLAEVLTRQAALEQRGLVQVPTKFARTSGPLGIPLPRIVESTVLVKGEPVFAQLDKIRNWWATRFGSRQTPLGARGTIHPDDSPAAAAVRAVADELDGAVSGTTRDDVMDLAAEDIVVPFSIREPVEEGGQQLFQFGTGPREAIPTTLPSVAATPERVLPLDIPGQLRMAAPPLPGLGEAAPAPAATASVAAAQQPLLAKYRKPRKPRAPKGAAPATKAQEIIEDTRLDAVSTPEVRPALAEDFVPTAEWQPVPPGTILPPGLEIRMPMAGESLPAARLRRITPASPKPEPILDPSDVKPIAGIENIDWGRAGKLAGFARRRFLDGNINFLMTKNPGITVDDIADASGLSIGEVEASMNRMVGQLTELPMSLGTIAEGLRQSRKAPRKVKPGTEIVGDSLPGGASEQAGPTLATTPEQEARFEAAMSAFSGAEEIPPLEELNRMLAQAPRPATSLTERQILEVARPPAQPPRSLEEISKATGTPVGTLRRRAERNAVVNEAKAILEQPVSRPLADAEAAKLLTRFRSSKFDHPAGRIVIMSSSGAKDIAAPFRGRTQPSRIAASLRQQHPGVKVLAIPTRAVRGEPGQYIVVVDPNPGEVNKILDNVIRSFQEPRSAGVSRQQFPGQVSLSKPVGREGAELADFIPAPQPEPLRSALDVISQSGKAILPKLPQAVQDTIAAVKRGEMSMAEAAERLREFRLDIEEFV